MTVSFHRSPLVGLVVCFAACGGNTVNPSGTGGQAADGAASASGGVTNSGGQAADGGQTTGGATTDGTAATGGSTSTGGTGAGGAGAGGAPTGTGGALAGTGGATEGSGGACSCILDVGVPFCGVDGVEYVPSCAEGCAEVDVDCLGSCPCAACGCGKESGGFCDAGETQWQCGTTAPLQALLDAGCQDAGTSAIRYCCPEAVAISDWCDESP